MLKLTNAECIEMVSHQARSCSGARLWYSTTRCGTPVLVSTVLLVMCTGFFRAMTLLLRSCQFVQSFQQLPRRAFIVRNRRRRYGWNETELKAACNDVDFAFARLRLKTFDAFMRRFYHQ
jgi:hypothetical protein